MNAGKMADEVARLRALCDRLDSALTAAMDLAQYPSDCWSEDQDAELNWLFQECAEIYVIRERDRERSPPPETSDTPQGASRGV